MDSCNFSPSRLSIDRKDQEMFRSLLLALKLHHQPPVRDPAMNVDGFVG